MYQPRLLLLVQDQREHYESDNRAAAARTGDSSGPRTAKRTADARALWFILSHSSLIATAAEYTAAFLCPVHALYRLFLASLVCKEGCMHRVHGFACRIQRLIYHIRPYRARLRSSYAAALKMMHKAGRRGGESIARFPTNDFNCNLYQRENPTFK